MTVYRPQIRILTAEDPIDYVYEQFSQSEVNERIGNTFARYLRAFLRHDPEVIMVGEIRDEETAEMAFRAAQTGHLLLSTLHTNDAISAVARLLDLKVDPNMIASSLIGVLAQRLVRQVCADCKQEYQPTADLMREFFDKPPPDMKFYRGAGCPICNFTGYRGRMSVAELWVPNEQDVILISKGAPFDEVRASAKNSTIPMAEDVIDRLKDGHTTMEELIRVLPVQQRLPVPSVDEEHAAGRLIGWPSRRAVKLRLGRFSEFDRDGAHAKIGALQHRQQHVHDVRRSQPGHLADRCDPRLPGGTHQVLGDDRHRPGVFPLDEHGRHSLAHGGLCIA